MTRSHRCDRRHRRFTRAPVTDQLQRSDSYPASGTSSGPEGLGGASGLRLGGMAAEASASYDAADASVDPLLARLRGVAEEVVGLDLDAHSDEQLGAYLAGLRRPLAMLEAARARLMAALEDRAAARLPPGGNGRAARDEQRRELADSQRIPRTRAKREAEAGRAAQQHQATGAVFADGDIGPEHVRLIAELLSQVAPDTRERVERQLLDLARDCEPVAFGRKARALVIALAPERTAEADRRKEARRELRVADTADGHLVFSGRLYGTSAEVVRTALDAFRRFDTPDSPRTTEQRNADALVQLCDVALKADEAPTRHGARPHVVVLVNAEDLQGGSGVATFGHSGQPVNLAQVRRLFADSLVSRVAFTAEGALVEASAGVRTVPAALWRALLARDGGCTWDGCTAPPSWCDVAHGNVPFRANQPLHAGDAALLCRRHHTRYDHGPYRMVIDGTDVSYLRLDTDGRPLGAPNPTANGPTTRTGRPRPNGSPDPASPRATTTPRQRPDHAHGDDAATPRGSTASGRAGPDHRPSGGPPAESRAGTTPPPAPPNAPPNGATSTPVSAPTSTSTSSPTSASTSTSTSAPTSTSTSAPTNESTSAPTNESTSASTGAVLDGSTPAAGTTSRTEVAETPAPARDPNLDPALEPGAGLQPTGQPSLFTDGRA